jgi:hypothetical protein
MITHKPLEGTAYASAGAYDQEIKGFASGKLAIKASGQYDVGGGVAVLKTDAAFRFFGSNIEVRRNGKPIVRIAPQDARFADTITHERRALMLAPTAIAAAQKWLAQVSLDFNAFMPGGLVSSLGGDIVTVSGVFGAAPDVGTNISVVSGRLRVEAENVEAMPAGHYWQPRWLNRKLGIPNANSEQVEKFSAEDRPLLVRGFLLRAEDASDDAASEVGSRDDGLVKAVTLSINRKGKVEFLGRRTWGMLKKKTYDRFKVPLAEEFAGQVFWELEDDLRGDLLNGFVLHPGDSIEIVVDTAAAAEEEFTATVPAAGDLFVVTPIAYELTPTPPGAATVVSSAALGKR